MSATLCSNVRLVRAMLACRLPRAGVPSLPRVRTAAGAVSSMDSSPATAPLPLSAIIADGTRQYPGRVVAKFKRGVLVDIGFQRNGFLQCDPRSSPAIGAQVDVYPVALHRTAVTGKEMIDLSLFPQERPRLSWNELNADGTTPVEGRIVRMGTGGASVDIHCNALGFLGPEDLAKLEERTGQPPFEGQQVTVYPFSKFKRRNSVDLALEPQLRARDAWDSLVCDGQTPYVGRVVKLTTGGALVDVNGDGFGFLPDIDTTVPLAEGQEVTVYINRKMRDSGKMVFTTKRGASPRERFEAIVADGVTPYTGRVLGKPEFGVLVDINAEVPALIPRAGRWGTEEQEIAQLEEGQELTVYIKEKQSDVGKLTAALRPHDTPLVSLHALRADGVTKHKGVIVSITSLGAFFHFGADRCGLLRRARGEPVMFEHHWNELEGECFKIGQQMDVYVVRKNMASGKIELSRTPTAQPRMSLFDVQAAMSKTYLGTIYHVAYNEVLVDFGCEATGVLSRQDVPDAIRGAELHVAPVSYDVSSGRFKMRATGSVDVARVDVPQRVSSEDPVQWAMQRNPEPGVAVRYVRRDTGEELLELPKAGWVEVPTETGVCYYWNLSTGQTTWTRPTGSSTG